MTDISLEKIHAQVLKGLNTALERALENENQQATSFGFWIDGRFGKCGVALNDDDDKSYRCPEIQAFTQRHIFGLWLDEIGDMDSRARELPENPAPLAPLISVHSDAEGIVGHRSVEAFCEWLHEKAVSWITEWFETLGFTKWTPCWIHVEETNSGNLKIWRYGKRPLPAESSFTSFPESNCDLQIPKEGLKVYRLIAGRKYCYNWVEHRPGNPRFIGQSVTEQVKQPLAGKTQRSWLKVGGLAESSPGTFALREADPAFGEVREFYLPMPSSCP